MAIASDFSVDRATGNIRHTSGTSTYTVLALHRYLQDLADDAAAAGDDELDITDQTPSERATDNIITLINGYNIDDTAATFLYDGSITQASGATVYSGLVVQGSLASGNLEIIQNNVNISDTWSTHLNADATIGIIMRCLVKSRTGGADIDGKRIRVQSRTFGYTYFESSATLGSGNVTAVIFTETDRNNQTASATVGAWTITNTEGYQALDVDANGVNENYYSQWDPGTQSINDLYEYAKYIQRDGTSETLYGLSGALFRGITHSIAYSSKTGTPTQNETVSWGAGATAGTGKLFGFSGGASGTIYIQLLTGVIVTTGTVTGGTSAATWAATSATARTIKPVFLGTSTGSAVEGAYGLGIKVTELSVSDILTDLTGTTITPPNNVTFTVSGLVSGEDRVSVYSWDGSSVDGQGNAVEEFDQFALHTTLNGAAVTAVKITASIPSDTPASGVIRVVNDEGYRIRLPYTSWATDTFTITSANFSGSGVTDSATSGNGVSIGYIDKLATGTSESFSVIYNSNRDLVVKVRDGASTPIKTFISSAVLGSAGGSTTAIRTTDA